MTRSSAPRIPGVLFALFCVLGAAIGNEAGCAQPNLLFAIADDWSWPHAGAYGDPAAKTPSFDRVAHNGVLFENTFCAAPQCSPNRASILTGRPIWMNEEAGTHGSLFPSKFKVYPDLLEAAGYTVGFTGKGWGPGNWEDGGWSRNPAGPEFNTRKLEPPAEGISNKDYTANFEDFLKTVPEGKPFCFWYGAHEPHRFYEAGVAAKMGVDPEKGVVPGFLPDHPVIRRDVADYHAEVSWFDRHLGIMLDRLEELGELENTLVVVTADNGMPFPRAKANLYEHGIHVPLAVMWPAKVKPGRRILDPVSFIDYAPTFLEAVGLPSEPAMLGRSFLDLLESEGEGRLDPTRRFALSGRERHTHARPDNLGYPARSIRTDEYLYIWNMKPNLWPAGDDLGEEGFYDIDACPAKSLLLEHRNDPQLSKYFEWAVGRRPEFELYDIRADPDCLVNLAAGEEYDSIRKALHATLEASLVAQGDPRVLGFGDVFDSYPRFAGMREAMGGFHERGAYNPAFVPPRR